MRAIGLFTVFSGLWLLVVGASGVFFATNVWPYSLVGFVGTGLFLVGELMLALDEAA